MTPFLVRFYQGTISLDPTADVWVDTNQLEVNDITMMGSLDGVASALQVELRDNADGTRSGVSPIIWGSWETTGVDVDFDLDVSNEVEQGANTIRENPDITANEFESLFNGGGQAGRDALAQEVVLFPVILQLKLLDQQH